MASLRFACAFFLALTAAACAKGSSGGIDAGPGGDIDGGGPGTPDARPRIDGSPGSEACNGADDDGDTFIDEGTLCTDVENGTGRCNGMLGCVVDMCDDGFLDVDGDYENGCECGADLLEASGGNDCASARDLGDFADTNSAMEIIANVIPEADEDWYRFRATDSVDSVCDNYHVRALFLENPSDEFIIDVWQGGCAGTQICDGGTDMQWYTNFSAGGLGECPCGPTSTNHCADNTAEYHVRVRRKAGSAVTCSNYRLELSNGKYPAP